MNRITNGDIGTTGLAGTSVVIVNDLHHDPAGVAGSNKYYQDTITKLNLLAPIINARSDLSLAIAAGDLIDGSANTSAAQTDIAAFMTAFNGINIPKVVIPGNHDLLHLTKAQVYAATGQASGYFSRTVSGPGGTFTAIFLDGNYTADDDSADRSNDNGAHSQYVSFIPPTQRSWLDDTLAASPYPCVVVCHYPIYYAGLDGSGTWQINNSAAVRTIIEGSRKVIVCLSGHVHQNWFYRDPISGTWYGTLHAFVTGQSPKLTYSVATIYPAKRSFKLMSSGYNLSHLPAL
jgi:3',5'-cyclic AMP phosphodiesterase CpdA